MCECAPVDCRGRAEEAVHEQRREHMAGEGGEDDDTCPGERQRHEADERKAEQRGKPWTVGDHAARQQQPEPAVGDRLGARCEV